MALRLLYKSRLTGIILHVYLRFGCDVSREDTIASSHLKNQLLDKGQQQEWAVLTCRFFYKQREVDHEAWHQAYYCTVLSPASLVTLNRFGWNQCDREWRLLRRLRLPIFQRRPGCGLSYLLPYRYLYLPLSWRCAGAISGVIANILVADCDSTHSTSPGYWFKSLY